MIVLIHSNDEDTSPCTFSVCKADDDICFVSNKNHSDTIGRPLRFFWFLFHDVTSVLKAQIRLNFDTFNIAQPSTNYPEDNSPNGRTQCQVCIKTSLKAFPTSPFQKAQFSSNSAGPSAPVICGTNTGYHMILEV